MNNEHYFYSRGCIYQGKNIICKLYGPIKEQNESGKLMASSFELLVCLEEAIGEMQLETNNVPEKWIDAVKKATE